MRRYWDAIGDAVVRLFEVRGRASVVAWEVPGYEPEGRETVFNRAAVFAELGGGRFRWWFTRTPGYFMDSLMLSRGEVVSCCGRGRAPRRGLDC